jgi:hypothetical protein
MTPDDLIHAAPAIAKGAAAIGAAIPFTTIVKRMLGPTADEVAEMWRDKVRLYRYERQLKCVEKAERMANEAGFTPQPVPPKILFPLLEGEENEDLHTMWEALLANAASPDSFENVRPGFIATLRQMAPDEAAVLNWISDRLDSRYNVELSLHLLYSDLAFGPGLAKAETRLRVCLGGLESAGLVGMFNLYSQSPYSFTFLSEEGKTNFSTGFPLYLPQRGVDFVTACRPPKPKAEVGGNPA